MAQAKNKTVKKKPIKKAINKKVLSKKVTKKSKSNESKIKVTLEQRHKMICEAAYYISLEKTYDTVSPTEDWLQAETFINKICSIHAQ